MKKVLGISLSSGERDHKAVVELKGEKISIERIGTDGDFEKARELFKRYDSEVDAFGLGGIDITLGISRRYKVRDAYKLINGLSTGVFDGNGIKHVLDRKSMEYVEKKGIDLMNKKVFMVCACNRRGMAEEFEKYRCNMVYGDFMFGLKLDIPVRSLRIGNVLAGLTLPIVTKLPHKFLYPIGKSQNERKPRFTKYFKEADIIAGDFHYIYKYSPDNLDGKIMITTTTTSKDVKEMKERGVSCLITTTPEIDGRCFGSNIIEAMMHLVNCKIEFKPSIKWL